MDRLSHVTGFLHRSLTLMRELDKQEYYISKDIEDKEEKYLLKLDYNHKKRLKKRKEILDSYIIKNDLNKEDIYDNLNKNELDENENKVKDITESNDNMNIKLKIKDKHKIEDTNIMKYNKEENEDNKDKKKDEYSNNLYEELENCINNIENCIHSDEDDKYKERKKKKKKTEMKYDLKDEFIDEKEDEIKKKEKEIHILNEENNKLLKTVKNENENDYVNNEIKEDNFKEVNEESNINKVLCNDMKTFDNEKKINIEKTNEHIEKEIEIIEKKNNKNNEEEDDEDDYYYYNDDYDDENETDSSLEELNNNLKEILNDREHCMVLYKEKLSINNQITYLIKQNFDQLKKQYDHLYAEMEMSGESFLDLNNNYFKNKYSSCEIDDYLTTNYKYKNYINKHSYMNNNSDKQKNEDNDIFNKNGSRKNIFKTSDLGEKTKTSKKIKKNKIETNSKLIKNVNDKNINLPIRITLCSTKNNFNKIKQNVPTNIPKENEEEKNISIKTLNDTNSKINLYNENNLKKKNREIIKNKNIKPLNKSNLEKMKSQNDNKTKKNIILTNYNYTEENSEEGICPVCEKGESVSSEFEMVGCDSCNKWFHFECVNYENNDCNESWYCPKCISLKNKDKLNLYSKKIINGNKKGKK